MLKRLLLRRMAVLYAHVASTMSLRRESGRSAVETCELSSFVMNVLLMISQRPVTMESLSTNPTDAAFWRRLMDVFGMLLQITTPHEHLRTDAAPNMHFPRDQFRGDW